MLCTNNLFTVTNPSLFPQPYPEKTNFQLITVQKFENYSIVMLKGFIYIREFKCNNVKMSIITSYQPCLYHGVKTID